MTGTPAPAAPPFRDRLLREGRMMFLFGVVGACAFVVDASLLKAGLALGLQYVVARTISILIAMHFGFALNRAWAFKGLRGQPLVQQWLGYLLANGTGALLNLGMSVFLSHPGAPFDRAPILAAAAGTIAGMFVNFTGSRLLAFRR
jgi:putative flippase GtrA